MFKYVKKILNQKGALRFITGIGILERVFERLLEFFQNRIIL
jgi:hypothetical protein